MTLQPKKRGRSHGRNYQKLAISMPHSVVEKARAEVEALGIPSLSAYIVQAVEEKLERHRFRAMLDEIFREQPMTEEERTWADNVLDR